MDIKDWKKNASGEQLKDFEELKDFRMYLQIGLDNFFENYNSKYKNFKEVEENSESLDDVADLLWSLKKEVQELIEKSDHIERCLEIIMYKIEKSGKLENQPNFWKASKYEKDGSD